MNVSSVLLRIKRSYEKNLPLLNAYRKRLYPDFVFDRHAPTIKDDIPVFTFHFVEPAQFEEQLAFLAMNKYHTVTASEFLQMICGMKEIPERAVLLTFDDGWGSLWTYGYPLLKKYGMHGVSFINPALIREEGIYFPNLSDVWEGRAGEDELIHRERSTELLCTWPEIREMASTGVVEFQSHTMYHSRVFVSPKIVDFFHPSFDTYLNNHNLPVFKNGGQDNIKREAEWGMPIYEHAPRMQGKRRYFDDHELRTRCIEFVHENGGSHFFRNGSWRRRLRRLVEAYKKDFGEKGYYESPEELRESISWDLVESKRLIQEKVPGHNVEHLCFPFFTGSDLASKLSRQAGYVCNYWGILEDRCANKPGDDPFRILRVGEEFVFRLPGAGRKSLLEVVGQKLRNDSSDFFGRLLKPDHTVYAR